MADYIDIQHWSLFSQPWTLWLLTLLPSLGMLAFLTWRRKRLLLSRFANWLALRSLLAVQPWARFCRGVCLLLGLVFLIFGMAGPQWGYDRDYQTMPGRDIVVVLDLSRTMAAEKEPSRLKRAKDMLEDLAAWVKQRGGHRLALVVFAGKAKVVCPLTRDYDHFLFVLRQQDAERVPPELRPDPEDTDTSGTRIGAALRLAASLHNPDYQGSQDVLLLSDGDDPLDTGEWRVGTEMARGLKIPVDVVGVGDPDHARWIPYQDGFLIYEGKKVLSKLQEETLKEIARRTHGTYFPARTKTLPLGQLYQEVLANRLNQRPEEEEESIPVLKPRHGWFLAPALVFLTVTMLLADGRKWRKGKDDT